MKIGLVIADENEYIPFSEFANKNSAKQSIRRKRESLEFTFANKEIIAVKAGIGKVNAATVAAFLIADDKVDTILSFGLSGAISKLSKNDIVAGTSYTECDFDLTPIGYKLGAKPQNKFVYEADKKLLDAALSIDGIKTAVCGCGDLFLADKERKNLYKETFGIEEFDMETGAIASVCQDADIPYLAIRQISDTADDSAADSYTALNNECPADLTEVIKQLIEIL